MPLDGHSYLVAQGWSGKGSGLRHGSISRPLAIPQKKTLAGLGKDRDDAFPFWDHLFTVAAKTIQIKVHKGEDDSSNTGSNSSPPLPTLTRTSTGILSNKRPMTGTPASSGSSTPLAEASSSSSSSRIRLITTAKRESARRGLYSRFFRGPVLGPDDDLVETKAASSSTVVVVASTSHLDISVSAESADGMATDGVNQREERKEKKERRKEVKEGLKEEKRVRNAEKKEKKRKGKGKVKELASSVQADGTKEGRDQKQIGIEDDDVGTKISKKRKREARRNIESEDASVEQASGEEDQKRRKKRKKKSLEVEVDSAVQDDGQESKSKSRTKEEKRRRKEEKAVKQRRREAQASLSQSQY